ncbi:hypothetical protein ACN2WE_27460 [Streptomyces sp. cg28]|uniref:hypothetical protein n=1 Tax=Streptomyces sp. cg28 TaxID=3403457 RepID=UPI003B21DDE8
MRKGKGGSGGSSQGASRELTDHVEAQRTWVACLRGAGLDAPDPDATGTIHLGDQSKRATRTRASLIGVPDDTPTPKG